MKEPLISVIMPAYNACNYIKRAIESVLNQTYQNFELIIVEDCSSDNTADLLKKTKDPRIKIFFNKKNMGPSYSRNVALENMNGEFVTVLDSDDYYAPNRLEILYKNIMNEPNSFITDNSVIFSGEEGQEVFRGDVFKQKNIKFKNSKAIYQDLLTFIKKGAPVIKALVPTNVIRSSGIRYDNNLTLGEDLKFYLKIFQTGCKLKLIDYKTYYYRVNFNSITRANNKNYIGLAGIYNDLSKKFINDGNISGARTAQGIRDKHLVFAKLKNKKYFEALSLFIKNPFLLKYFIMGVIETFNGRLINKRAKGIN